MAINYHELRTEFRLRRPRPQKWLSNTIGWLGIALMTVFIITAFQGCAVASPHNIVTIAKSELGHGEQGSDNHGFWIHTYTHGQNVAWCAGFVSYVLHKAHYTTPYTLRAKDYLHIGKAVSKPKVGDLIVFTRKGGGHVGIVEHIAGNNITTIEGNVGAYPAKVREFHYKLGNIKNLKGFVRV